MRPTDLCSSPRVIGAHVEFTSACNLKCAYCAVSQPQYVPLDFEEGALDGAIDDLIKIGVPEVGVSGHRETTSLPNWQIHASKLIEANIHVNAISNLAKEYSRDELRTLARFNVLVISVDTIDIDVFKRLRRGADLRTVLYNIGAVRAAALELGKQPPVFRWASVVCDRTVFGLPALVRYGLAMGIREFAFQNLVKMPEVKSSIDFKPIAVMGREELAKVPAIFDEIEALIAAHGGVCDIQPGLREALDEKVEGVYFKADKTKSGVVYRARKSDDDMTRDCIDPWSALYISSNGAVKPCCVMRENVGRIGVDGSLSDIFNGPGMREYRQGILDGTLAGACKDCHSRGWITKEAMAAKVRAYIDGPNAVVEEVVAAAPEPTPSVTVRPVVTAAPEPMPSVIVEPVVAAAPEPTPSIIVEPVEVLMPLEVADLRNRLAMVERSAPWRITAPIRAVKRALMG